MEKNAIKEALLTGAHFRRAIREYTDQKITNADLDYILEIGRMSPSSVGLLDWRILVFNDGQSWNEIRKHAWGAKKSIEHAADTFIVFVARKDVRYDELLTQNIKDRHLDPTVEAKVLNNYQKFQLNDMEIPQNDRLGFFDWAAKQTYLALGAMMTAASAIGIDSCPIEGFNRKEVNEILTQQHLIDPQKESAAVMLSLGYRLKDPKRPQVKLSKTDFAKFIND